MKHDDYTHIIFVLDASGSMRTIQSDIKGSFNAFLDKQREESGKTVFDLFQFNNTVKRIVKSADLALFHDDLMAKYECSGCTALNDAVCTAIDTVGHEFADMPEENRPEHVLCVIITDGLENASCDFTTQDVKERIEHQKTKYNWEFVYLAADPDAFDAGEDLGFDNKSCMAFSHDHEGVEFLCEYMNCCMNAIRKKPRKK